MASAASTDGEGVFGRGYGGAGGCPSRPRIPPGLGGLAVDLRRDIQLRFIFFHKFDKEAFLGHYKVHRYDIALPVLPHHKLG